MTENPTEPIPDDRTAPIRTRQTLERLLSKFRTCLLDRAKSNITRRHSETLTEADLEDAYRELMPTSGTSRLRRCFGVAAIGAGGYIMPLNNASSPSLPIVAGIIVLILGIYIREFLD